MNWDWLGILEILEIALIAGIKFLFAPFIAEGQGFGFKEAFIVTTAGGLLGILTFTFVGDLIANIWQRLWIVIRSGLRRGKNPSKKQKKFHWLNKFIVRIRMNFGLWGIAFITPSIISIPIGTFVANRFFRNKWKILLCLSVSLLFWSVIINWIAHTLKLSQYLPNVIFMP